MEVWKDIKGYEGIYQISNFGIVRNLVTNKIHKGNVNRYGYSRTKFGKKARLTHRVVAMSFIPNPENKPQVNHINGIKTDNRVENLEWCNSSENNKHAHIIGLKNQKGSKNNRSILSESDVYKIKYQRKNVLNKDVAIEFNIHENYVGCIKRNERWKHI